MRIDLGLNRFLPSMGSLKDKFNYNKFMPSPQEQPMQEDAPPDFASSYAKITGNRPNKLAYQQAITEGNPVINRGKWAKFGALLAAGGSALGGQSASDSANFGINAYNLPQERADTLYNQRVKGLGSLAGMEQDDINSQIKALEATNDNWYKRRADTRAEKETTATIANQTEDNLRQKEALNQSAWIPFEGQDGNTYLVNKSTQEKRLIGKSGMTNDEQIDFAKKKAIAEEDAKEAGRRSGDLRERETRLAVARQSGENSLAGIRERNAATKEIAANKLRAAGNALKPGDVSKQVYNDLAQAVASDPELDGIQPEKYLGIDASGVIAITPGSFWDGPADEAIRQKLKKVIDKSLANSKSAVTGVTQPTLPPGFSIRNQ